MSWDRSDFSLAAWHKSDECMRPAKVPKYFPGSKVWVPIRIYHPEGASRILWEPAVIVSTRGQSDQATPLKGPWPVRVEMSNGQRKWVKLKNLKPLDWKEE